MIINKLEMLNFRQYIGNQEIEFSTDPQRNVTILIGVNTSGKTTIVRAFEWCLYGKNGFEDPVLLNSEVKNKMNIGDTQEVSVSVIFSHNDTVYTLKRAYKYECVDKSLIDGRTSVVLGRKPEENLTLEYLQKDGQTKTPIDKANIEESINRVLPKDLSDYFFFGGERISGIASRLDLSKAIHGLMRLDVLENANIHLKTVIKGFESDIDTSGDSTAQKAKNTLETSRNKKKEIEMELTNINSQMDYWNGKIKEYDDKLAKSNIDKVKDLATRRQRVKGALAISKEKKLRLQNELIKAFNDKPYTYFGLPLIKESLTFLEEQNKKEEGIKESIPAMEQDAIDFLVKRCKCICGTELIPGTAAYRNVMEIRKVLPPEHVGTAVRDFKSKSEGFLTGTDAYKDKIDEIFKSYREINREINALQNEYDALENEKIDDAEARAIEEKRKDAVNKCKDANNDFNEANRRLGECNITIENCEKIIDKYAKNSEKNQRIARLIAYSEHIYNWLADTYKNKEVKVRDELQSRVNDNFIKMYHGERSIIIDDKYRVKYSDVTTEESDGLKAVKSFAFIASLVSMAKDKILDDSDMKLGQVYPLVMDAPFSNVDEIHINNICRILPKTANQVIMAVMQKDWEHAAKNLSSYVGKSYMIEKDRDENGKEIDTATHIV